VDHSRPQYVLDQADKNMANWSLPDTAQVVHYTWDEKQADHTLVGQNKGTGTSG
jgi:hypothetical protein